MRNKTRDFKRIAGVLPGLLILLACVIVLTPRHQADANNNETEAQPANTPAAPPPQNASFEVYPAQISLATNADQQSVIVRTRRADGVTIDLTNQAQISVEDTNIATVQDGVVTPAADGSTNLLVAHGGETVRVPITVTQAGEARPTSFRLDVIPVFSRVGCNNGSCHGSARGQDGFNLSLFGYDPAGDYNRILHEQPGRRINLADAARSLLLTKSIGTVPHTGGQLFDADHEF